MDSLIPEDDDEDEARTLIPEEESPRSTPAKTGQRKRVSDATLKRIQEFVNTPSRAKAESKQQATKPLGALGTIKEGAKSTMRALGAAADTYQGDEAEVVAASKAQREAPKDPRLEAFLATVEDHKKRLGDDPSLWESIKAVGSAAIDNPAGAALMVAEQIPNSAAALGAAGAGALAGSVAGPVGSVVGGLAGLAGANIGLETGHKAMEAASGGSFSPEEQSRVKGEGAIKGTAVSTVDALTLGATKFITGASRRAVETATMKTLADKGVDVADAAAVKAAMADPAVMASVNSARKLAAEASDKLGKKIARTGGAIALETIGEGVGEYVGEFAATGKANAVDAVVESLAGLSQSMGEVMFTSELNKRAMSRLFDSKAAAETAAKTDTDNTGVEYEVKPHPVEPKKFIAVPKTRTAQGVELERDAAGNIQPKAPQEGDASEIQIQRAELKPGFERTAEERILLDKKRRENAEAYARNPIILPGIDNVPASKDTPTIGGNPVTGMSNGALEYSLKHGGASAKQAAQKELTRRKREGIDPAIANATQNPIETIDQIISTGAEKAKETRKGSSVLTPTPTPVRPATPQKPASPGQKTRDVQVVLPDNSSLPAQWDIVDADSVNATIKEGKNQPRDRSRAASDVQIQGIANAPDYRRLADSPVMDVGAPTLSHDGLIVGGNGRFEGVSRAYDQGTANDYLTQLKADAVGKGIDPAKIDGMKKPILVRRITEPFDVRKLAIASNSGTGLQYSGLELAKIDSERMQNLENLDITDSGDIALTGSNMQNIRHSLSGYSAAELGSLVDKDGALSQEGVRRIRNAMLYAAYGSNPTLERLVESTDNDLRNISGALVKAAGSAAKARADIKSGRLPAELDISANLVSAVETLSKIRAAGMTVDEHLAQVSMFGDPLTEDSKEILRVLDANIRSQRKIADFIKSYYDTISNIDTASGDMFGNTVPTKPEILKNAKEKITDRTPQPQDLFSSANKPQAPAQSDAKSPAQSGNNASPENSGAKDQVKKVEPKPAPTPAPKAEPKPEPKPDTAPAKPRKAKPDKRREKLESHFTPGNVVTGYGGFDRVISFNWNDGRWNVEVQHVIKNAQGQWDIDPKDTRIRNHSTEPDTRDKVVGRFEPKPEPAKPEETNPLRPLVEALIKRRAAAKQSGKERSVNNQIARAKDVMDGKRTDPKADAAWFKKQAALMQRADPATAEILTQISEAIKNKNQVAPNKNEAHNESNEKPEKTESGNTPVPVRGDRSAVPSPRGGRILASGIAESIQKHGVAALIGQKITSPERLAELAQIYRNPQYETFRIFFTKGNTVVHASGVTARLPGNTPIFPEGKGFTHGLQWISDMMKSSGADGYWMLHNHPSGNPTPSNADVQVTQTLAQLRPGFKGHVIINSNKYAQIMLPRGRVASQVLTKHFGEDTLLKASKPSHYIGQKVPGPRSIATIGKTVQKDGWITLIGVAGVTGVRSIGEIPVTTLSKSILAKAAIRRFARNTGAGQIFAYGNASDLAKINTEDLIANGFLQDAVDENGSTPTVPKNGKKFGQDTGKSGVEVREDGPQVEQAAAAYNPSPPAKTPFRERIDKISDSLIYNFQDRFKPLKDIQNRAGPVSEDADASLAEERYSGMVRARTDTFEEQLRDPLIKAIHDSGVSYEDVESYLHALHAPSRNKAMQEINPTESELKAQTGALEKQRDSLAKDKDVTEFLKLRRELRQAEADIEDGIADESLATMIKRDIAALRKVDNVKDYIDALDKLKGLRLVKPFQGDNTALSGMSDKEAADILAKADKDGTRKALDKISGIVDTITARTRQIYVDSGLEKADAIEAWDKKYQHYVPLHRDEVSGNTMPKTGQGFNIRGRESKQATGSTKEVTNILAHVVAQHEAAIIRSEKSRVDRALFRFAQLNPNPELWTLDESPMIRTVDPVTGFVVDRVDPTYKNKAEVLTLKIDGDEHTITFNEKNLEAMRLAASMKNMSSEQLGEVTQLVGKVTRFLAQMNTTMNPVFTARNFLRDLQTAYVNLTDTAIADKKREVFRDVPAAIRGMWNLSRGKKNSQWAKYAEEFKAAGGQTGWMEHYRDIGKRADTLRKELEVMKPGRWNFTRRKAQAWLDIVQDANNAVENGARLSAYVNARKSGLSQGKAAQLAKNLTVNFNTHGAKGTELNAWYMFMNASIQGTARLIKALSHRQVRKIVAGVILSGFLMDIMARSMAGDDDEDGENDYDQLPEHVKSMNFVLWADDRPITIPMPYGYNFFASTGRKISEMIFRENHSAAKSAAELAGVFVDAFSPTGQAGSFLQYVAPTIADPAVQWAENKNFAGNPLRRPQSPFGVPNPEYQMGFKSTSAPAKWLAEVLNDETGGNEVRPGFVNVNPAFFDFAVSSIAGGAGRTYLQTISGPMKAGAGEDIQAREVPFANIFLGARPEFQTERKYFEAVKRVELVKKEIQTYREKGDKEMVNQILEDHGHELRLQHAAKETKKLLERLRKRDLALDKKDPPNKAELRKKMEEERREGMAKFNKRYSLAVAGE